MTAHRLDAHGPFWFTVTLALLPLLVAGITRPLSARLSAGTTQRWVRWTCWSACLASVWLSLISPDFAYVVAPPILFIPVACVFRTFEARFSSDDVVLVPALIVTFLAALDLSDGDGRLLLIASAWLIFMTRLLVARWRTERPALLFSFAPLGVIAEVPLMVGRSPIFDVVALIVVFVTPFLLLWRSADSRTLKRLLTWVVYPAFVYFLPLATGIWAAEGQLRVSFFEAGHSVLPASDMMHGARAYRDTAPMHGFIEDGGLDYLAMKVGRAQSLGGVMVVHELASQLNAPAMYAVTTAASASPAAGLLAVFFANCGKSLRCAVALFAVAIMIMAYRRRSNALLRRAAALTVLACLTSLDFGVYALVALAVTGLLMRPRAPAFGAIATGLLAAAVPIVLAFAVFGVVGSAIRRTINLSALAPAYNIGFFAPTKLLGELRYFPEVMLAFLRRPEMAFGAWIAAVIVVAVGMAMGAPRRIAPLLILASFVLATGVSYAERRHIYPIENGGYPMLFCAAAMLLRRPPPGRVYGRIVAMLLFMAAGVTADVAIMSSIRRQRGTTDPSITEVRELPRARGVFFEKPDADYLRTVNRFFAQNLGPTETFFDFTNRGLSYYLLDRRCPVPLNEVATYETTAAQQEVISRLEHQKEVRYALVPSENAGAFHIDGVPNRERVPLVWAYLNRNFRPVFQDGPVVFWKRVD